MAHRPNFIDIHTRSHGTLPSTLSSPRIHIAGDIPPELSPLDAFAAQSRLLARQLQESASNDKRISRLPPLAVAQSWNHGRVGYCRLASAEPLSVTPMTPVSPSSGQRTEVGSPGMRPMSIYPVVSGAHEETDLVPPLPPSPLPPQRLSSLEDRSRGRGQLSSADESGYFGARREQSPSSIELGQRPLHIKPRLSIDSIHQGAHISRAGNEGSLALASYDPKALAPPRSPFAPRTPSPRSISTDSLDDDYNATGRQDGALPDKFSVSGFWSTPISPSVHSVGRTSSISSEVSLGGTHLHRPQAFNFSRPLSRASTTAPLEDPIRQESSDSSQPSFILTDDTAHTPVSMHSEEFLDTSSDSGPAPAYIYSTFSLPRGKILQRNSAIFQDAPSHAQFPEESHHILSPRGSSYSAAPPSPPSRPSTSNLPMRPDTSQLQPPNSSRPSTSSNSRPPSFDLRPPREQLSRSAGRPPLSSKDSSLSTLKARSQHSLASSAEYSADEHVEKAIAYHEAGILNKSTYHLRLAARMKHPTGMLLYALACRHGWGMRPNQREGVEWLRRAADCAGLEVADEEDLMKEGKQVDILELKTKKAQFALSIYELGVSHMNGWGIEQDKVLALRCFEIAGSWGDADALAEAGFCYAQGVGCKKDLKKSARLYRQAEAKGISMVGNSWIYKSKYNEDPAEARDRMSKQRGRSNTSSSKETRNKSRTRGIFGRSKAHN